MRGKFSLDAFAKRVYYDDKVRRNRKFDCYFYLQPHEIYGFAEHPFN
jgi:hypothetical protein